MVKIKDKISAINALHSIPIMPKLRPKIIIAGTKKITSLEMDSKVELIESPQDCRNIVADLTMQVKIIPLKYILKQSLAYSIYDKLAYDTVLEELYLLMMISNTLLLKL